MPIKEKLVGLLKQAYQEEGKYIAGMSEEERAATAKVDDWAPKDTLAHVAEWKAVEAQRIEISLKGETPTRYEDFDEVNAQIFEKHSRLSWQEVDGFLARAHSELVESAQKMSENDLVDPQRFEWLEGRPYWQRIVNTAYFHSLWHIAPLYEARPDQDSANRLRETSIRSILPLDDSADWRGAQLYNLACFYALSGDKEESITQLKGALELRPNLKEWSQEDRDLESIWEEPEFKALVGS